MAAPIVLLVDDDAELGEVLQHLLEQEGCRSHWVRDAAAALDLLPLIHPDLVVAELMLPVMGGLELIEFLEPYGPMLAMCSSRQLLRQAIDHGAAFAIHKPFHPGHLIAAVMDLLEAGSVSLPFSGEMEGVVHVPSPIQICISERRDFFLEQLASTLGVDSVTFLSADGRESRCFGANWLSGTDVWRSPFAVILEGRAPVWFGRLERHSIFDRIPWLIQSRQQSFAGVPIWDGAGAFHGCMAVSGGSQREWTHLDAAILRLVAEDWIEAGSQGGVSSRAWTQWTRLLTLKAWEQGWPLHRAIGENGEAWEAALHGIPAGGWCSGRAIWRRNRIATNSVREMLVLNLGPDEIQAALAAAGGPGEIRIEPCFRGKDSAA